MKTQTSPTNNRNWLDIGLMLFFALLPFVYAQKGVDGGLLPRQIFASFLILFFAGWFLFKLKKEIVIRSYIPLLLLLLAVLYGVSIFQALNQIEAVYIAIKISVFTAFFLVVYNGIQEKIFTIKTISRGIAISGLIGAGLAIRDMLILQSQGVALFNGLNMYKVSATFGHKNLLSSYLFLCLPMLAIQWLYLTKKGWKISVAVLLLVMMGVIIVLQTRAVLMAGLICFCVAIVLILKSNRISASHQKIGIVLLVGLLIIGSIGGFLFREKFAGITRTESFIERKHVWENTWQMITENPVTGVGAANWQIHFPKYGMQKFYDVNYAISEGLTNFQRPHNDFLWVWAETGSLGFMAYALIFLLGCRQAYQLFKREHDKRLQIVYALIFLQIIGFVFISAVDFPLERIEHSLVIFTSIGFVAASYPSLHLRLQWPKWSWVVLMFVGLYSLLVCYNRWQSELQLRKMYKAHHSGNWAKLVTEGKKAQSPYLNMDYFSIPLSWYIGVGYFMQNNLPAAKQYFEEAYLLHPYQVHVLNNYGACYEKEGNHTKAIELLETTNRISPSFSDGIINLSGAYFNAGRYDDAYLMIGTIGYDDNNPRLKTFILVIMKKKLMLTIEQNKGSRYATYLNQLLSDDQEILRCFKEARSHHVDFLDYLNQIKK